MEDLLHQKGAMMSKKARNGRNYGIILRATERNYTQRTRLVHVQCPYPTWTLLYCTLGISLVDPISVQKSYLKKKHGSLTESSVTVTEWTSTNNCAVLNFSTSKRKKSVQSCSAHSSNKMSILVDLTVSSVCTKIGTTLFCNNRLIMALSDYITWLKHGIHTCQFTKCSVRTPISVRLVNLVPSG